MIEYHDDPNDESYLRVEAGATRCSLAIVEPKALGDEDEITEVFLSRDSAAALVGQLQSWLARAQVEAPR